MELLRALLRREKAVHIYLGIVSCIYWIRHIRLWILALESVSTVPPFVGTLDWSYLLQWEGPTSRTFSNISSIKCCINFGMKVISQLLSLFLYCGIQLAPHSIHEMRQVQSTIPIFLVLMQSLTRNTLNIEIAV